MKKSSILLIAVCTLGISACSVMKQLSDTLNAIQGCKYKLSNVNGFALNGVTLADKSKLSDFSLYDAARLVSAFTQKKLPAEFILNVAVSNPNNGDSGRKYEAVTIKHFPWTLYIDNTETISGDINQPFIVPAGGTTTMLPLSVKLDLVKFFEDRGYESIVNLSLAIGGRSGSTSNIQLKARPTIGTSIGDITSPNEITIIDKEFRDK